MNKQSYRVVFNKARGQLMAVAETAHSAHGAGRTGASSMRESACAYIRPLTLSLWLGGLVGLALPSQAQIVVDPHAPANQRPNVLTSPNGTPVVNIQTPSAAGVSRNTYQQFDVNAQGVILNNARTGQRTQTGGAVAGNPWLARGTARVILNEVNSSNPSQLRGYVEVSGDRAQVVIANPAGITCDGCGFINANRATLTTGTPVVNGGSLDAYRVERGTVKIEGRGLDTSGTNYTDIIARTTQINGKVYAKDLKVTTGANVVSADNSQTTRIAGQGEAGSVAIDTGTLGGMYANKIHLVGTEAGVGVRNAGQIGAAAGDVIVTVDGQIVNSGQIQASGDAVLTGRRITNSGTLYAGRAQLKAGQIDHQSGLIGASGSVSLLAEQIKSAQGAALAAGMQADGTLSGDGALTLQADQIDSQGDHLAAGDITVKGRRINLSDALLQTKMTMRAEGESLNTDRAKLIAANYLMAAYVLSNRGGQIFQTSSGNNQFRVRELDNTEGTVVLKGDTQLDLGKLDNTKGAWVNQDGALHLRTVELNNTEGQIEASDSTQTGNGLRTKAGTDLHIEASGSVNNTRGTITGHQTSLVSGNLIETGGILLGKDALSVQAQGSTGDGELLTQGTLNYQMAANVIYSGKIIAKVASLSTEGLWTQAGSLQAETFNLRSQGYTQTDKGEVEAQTGHLQTGQFSNQGLINVDTLRLDATDARNAGRLYGNQISLGAAKLTNDKGAVIAAREQLELGVGELHNQGDVLSMGDMHVGGRLDDQGKALEQATLVRNSSGLIEAQGQLDINARRTVNERTTFTMAPNTPTLAERKYAVGTEDDGSTSVIETQVHQGESQVTQDSGAGMIRGGAVTIRGALHNDKSQVQGGDVQYDPTQYTEAGASGQRTVRTDTLVNGQLVSSTTQASAFEVDGMRPLITATGRLSLTNRTEPSATTAPAASQAPAATEPAPAAAPSTPPEGTMTRARAMPLPNSQLFQVSTEGNTLLQTDARFANTQSLVNGEAQLKALGVDPASLARRLGDGLMEQRIITEQIINLTGRQHLAGYASTQEEYQALLNNGVEAAKALGLQPGQALTEEQVKKLGKDIVWLEERTVSLPDGRSVRALVPQVYAKLSERAPTRLAVTQGVGVVSGAVIDIDIQGAYTQRGMMSASQAVQIKADDLTLQGQVVSRDIFLQATHDIVNDGAQVMAGRHLSVQAGGDIRGASSMTHSGPNTEIGRLSAWSAGNTEQGDLLLDAGRDLRLSGSLIQNNSTGVTALKAGRDIVLDTVQVSSETHTRVGWRHRADERTTQDVGTQIQTKGGLLLEAGRDVQTHAAMIDNTGKELTIVKAGRDIQLGTGSASSHTYKGTARNHTEVQVTQDLGTQIQAQADVQLDAGRDLHATGAMIQSKEGGVLAIAKNDILLDAGERRTVVDEVQTKTKRRVHKKVTTVTHTHTEQSEALGTGISGVTVQMQAGQDITARGAQIASDKRTQLVAGRDVNLGTADNTQDSHTEVKRYTSGVFKSGSMSVTLGRKTETTQNDTVTHTVTGTRVGSTQGDVVIQAGRNYTQTGSEVLAQGDVQIQAANVLIQEARNTQQVHQRSHMEANGLTLAVSSSALGMVQSVAQMNDAARTLDGDGRMQALAGMSAGMNAYNLGSMLNSGSMGDVSATLTLGSSHSSSEAMQSLDGGVGSQVGGKNVRISASAGTSGTTHDLTVRGSNIQASEAVSLHADGELHLLASEDHRSEGSSNRSGNAGVGIGATASSGGAGMGMAVVGGVGQGDSHGEALVHRNSHVTAGQVVSLSSGGDTVIQGAVVTAPQISGDIGGQLIMASLQDTASYSGKQWQVSGTASFGWGAGVSVQASGNHLSNDYQSVNEQTALRAGDGGFQITARGGTQLTGAQITSTQAAVDANRNVLSTPTLEVRDLNNHSGIQGQAFGISHSAGSKETKDDKGNTKKADTVSYSGGVGNIDERGTSVSTAGVSGLAGDRDARTGDAATGLVNHFDPVEAQKNLTAQVAITQAFSAVAPKAVADFALLQQKQATRQLQAAIFEQDPAERARMIQEGLDQLAGWQEGGRYRVAAHALAGALGAGWQGAVGAGGSAVLKDDLAALQRNVFTSLTDAGFSGDVAKMLSQLTVQAGTTLVGASVAGLPGAQWSTSVDVNNRQLHPYELKWIADRGKDFAAKLSQALERPVTELEADYWLTVAGQSDVDRQMAQSNREFVRGLGLSEEGRSYDLAKAYIASNTKGVNPANAFIDERGQLQNVFSTTGLDYYRPEVYSEWRNNAHYRDYHWTVLGLNLKGEHMTPEEQAVYDQRQELVNKQTVKELVTFAAVGVAGRRAITAPQRAAQRTAAQVEAEAIAARRVEVNASRDADMTTPVVTGRAEHQKPVTVPEPQAVVGAYSAQPNPELIHASAGPGYTSAPRYDPTVASASVPEGYRAYDMPNLPSGMRGVVDIHTGEIKAYSDTGQVFDIGSVRQPVGNAGGDAEALRGLGGTAGHALAESVTPGGSGRAFAGHGVMNGMDTFYGRGELVVPQGTSVVMPRPGISIYDSTGRLLENVNSVDELNRAIATGVGPNGQILTPRNLRDLQGYEVVQPGQTGPNLTLLDPGFQGKTLNIMQNSTTTLAPTRLSDLLEPNMGCVFWAACTQPVPYIP